MIGSRGRWALFVACVLFWVPTAAPAQPQTLVTLRIGTTMGDAFAEPFYADAMGFFREAHIKPAISVFSSGAAVSAAVLSGAIDLGISNVGQLARAIGHGAPFLLIGGGGMYSSDSPIVALVVRTGASVRAAKDLEGRTVAITPKGDVAEIGLRAWLSANGTDGDAVHAIELPFADMEPALQNHLVDAAILAEPWLSAALHTGRVRVLAKPYDAVGPMFIVGAWFTTQQWYAEHSGAAKRFVETIYRTARWANEHHDQSARILAKYSRIDRATIRSTTRAPYATSLDAAALQPILDLAFKYRVIGRWLDVNALIAK